MRNFKSYPLLVAVLYLILWSPFASAQGDPQIRQAQERLNTAGFDPGPLDGRLGRQTTEALRQYQAAHGMPQTGSLDKATLEALGMEKAMSGPQLDEEYSLMSVKEASHLIKEIALSEKVPSPFSPGHPRSKTSWLISLKDAQGVKIGKKDYIVFAGAISISKNLLTLPVNNIIEFIVID